MVQKYGGSEILGQHPLGYSQASRSGGGLESWLVACLVMVSPKNTSYW